MIDIDLVIDGHLKCLPNTLFVTNLEVGERKTASGLIIPEENMHLNQRFIKSRWAQVYCKADNITNLEIGDWILLEHGHWSTCLNLIIDNKPIKLWYVTEKNYKTGIQGIQKRMPTNLKDYVL